MSLRLLCFGWLCCVGCSDEPISGDGDTDDANIDSPGDTDDNTTDSLTTDDTDDDSGPPIWVTLTGAVEKFDLGADVPLEGIELSIENDATVPMVLSDAAGAFVLADVPGNAEVLVSYVSPVSDTNTAPTEEYTSLLAIYRTGEADAELVVALLLTPDDLAFVGSLSIEPDLVPDPDMGFIAFAGRAGDESGALGIAGITVSLDPALGEGPFYNNLLGLPSSDEAATSDLGDALGGGVYGNVPEGDYLMTFEHDTLACSAGTMAWPAAEPGVFHVPVRAGYISFLSVICL